MGTPTNHIWLPAWEDGFSVQALVHYTACTCETAILFLSSNTRIATWREGYVLHKASSITVYSGLLFFCILGFTLYVFQLTFSYCVQKLEHATRNDHVTWQHLCDGLWVIWRNCTCMKWKTKLCHSKLLFQLAICYLGLRSVNIVQAGRFTVNIFGLCNWYIYIYSIFNWRRSSWWNFKKPILESIPGTFDSYIITFV